MLRLSDVAVRNNSLFTHQASAEIGCFVEELVDTLRDKRDVDLVRHANDGLRVVKSGVEERSSQYQDLIRGLCPYHPTLVTRWMVAMLRWPSS